jgi:nucleotide-binding universal stress UspA family protein
MISPMKTFLVPVDFSAGTETLLQKCSEIARPFSARLVLLHVLEPVATYLPVGASMDVIVPPAGQLETDLLPLHRERLEQLALHLRSTGLTVEVLAIEGLPVEKILEQARTLPADLIALASHGHGALYHLFSGSVVTGILKRAACPVLVVPSRQASAVSSD